MSWSLAANPPPKGQLPATLEGSGAFCVKTAALVRPATPMRGDPSVVMLTREDGGVVVYPPSAKLAILAIERAKRTTPVALTPPPA